MIWKSKVIACGLALAVFCGCSTTVGIGDPYFMQTESAANVYASQGVTKVLKIAVMPFKASAELIGSSVSDMVVTELLKARLGENAARALKGVAVGFMFPEQRDAALRLAAKLRGEGQAVNLSLHPLKPKKFFSHADQSGAAQAVFLGPDDVAKGVARMKDMKTREEREICLS